MTLLQMINQELDKLPTIADELEYAIANQQWEDRRKEIATNIVRNIQGRPVVREQYAYGKSEVGLADITILLTPAECGINAARFDAENIFQADTYVRDILKQINRLSKDIKFSWKGRDPGKDKECKFYISWEF